MAAEKTPGRKPFQAIGAALKADRRVARAYIRRRAMEMPAMSALDFAEVICAELEASRHLDNPLDRSPMPEPRKAIAVT